MNITDIQYLLILASTIISLYYRNQFGNSAVRYLPYYLVFICFVEIGAFIIKISPIKYNVWWYNIMQNGELFFFFYLFFNFIENKFVKKILLVLFIISILYFIINYTFFSDSWLTPQTFSCLFGNIVIIFSAFWYLLEVFQSDQVLIFHKNIMFWLTLGILFYLIVAVPFNVSMYFFAKKEYINNDVVVSFSLGMFIANLIFYFLIIFGILWTLKPQKS